MRYQLSHKTLDKSFESLEFKKTGEEDQEHEAKMNAMVERASKEWWGQLWHKNKKFTFFYSFQFPIQPHPTPRGACTQGNKKKKASNSPIFSCRLGFKP